MFNAVETDDLAGLQDMFEENGLEVSEAPYDFVKCWEIRAATDGRVAALRLEKRRDEFVIVGICVIQKFRKHGLGSILLNKAIEEARSLGGKRILLVAKVPGFFRKSGFERAEPKEFEGIISCLGCGLYNDGCFPKFMSLSL